MRFTTKQNDELAVLKGKDKEGRFVELLTGWRSEQYILTPKEAVRLGNALIKAAQPRKQKKAPTEGIDSHMRSHKQMDSRQ